MIIRSLWFTFLVVAGTLFASRVSGQKAGTTLEQLEHRLLAANQVEVEFVLTVAGPVAGNLKGKLKTESGHLVDLTATGTLRGQQVTLALNSLRNASLFDVSWRDPCWINPDPS